MLGCSMTMFIGYPIISGLMGTDLIGCVSCYKG